MDLRKLPPPPPCPLQPSPARLGSVRPRGRWGFGGQDVRAKPGGGIKGAATSHSYREGIYRSWWYGPGCCHPPSQLPGMEG